MFWRRRSAWVCAGLLAALAWGCSPNQGPTTAILPTQEVGRAAVLAMLKAWADGKPTGGVESASPRIQVMDTTRRAGQVLRKYEILGEAVGESALVYVVRVELSDPAATETIRFLVLGLDPVLVWRQEDYDMMSHWEHKMDPIADESSR